MYLFYSIKCPVASLRAQIKRYSHRIVEGFGGNGSNLGGLINSGLLEDSVV
ncbi:hypothetical protein BMS3Abin15_00993 [bacterium BMS3Abin15]|nr:hypothetical protein BMS3Abin15_00993 [bacterium BMS3Abin15]